MIEYVARSGPSEAMNCPAFICDACRQQVVGAGIVTWATTIGDGRIRTHNQSPLYVAHKGECGRKVGAMLHAGYPSSDGWMDLWDDIGDFLKQLTHNATNAFADDADGEYHQHHLDGVRTHGRKQ
ncbi:hypothetical protein AB0L50_29265 [Streptomyces flaveolus]|uniref:hypothetical protein n=1 Tax=Streptomyces flaveolus TaxID=67297 RepID=UPI003443EE15